MKNGILKIYSQSGSNIKTNVLKYHLGHSC